MAQRRKVLDDVNTIAAYAKDMKDFLKESELTERRAFIQSFVKEIVVVPGDALLRYTVPMPDDSLIPGRAAEKVTLPVPVLSTLPDGGPILTIDRTVFEMWVGGSVNLQSLLLSIKAVSVCEVRPQGPRSRIGTSYKSRVGRLEARELSRLAIYCYRPRITLSLMDPVFEWANISTLSVDFPMRRLCAFPIESK